MFLFIFGFISFYVSILRCSLFLWNLLMISSYMWLLSKTIDSRGFEWQIKKEITITTAPFQWQTQVNLMILFLGLLYEQRYQTDPSPRTPIWFWFTRIYSEGRWDIDQQCRWTKNNEIYMYFNNSVSTSTPFVKK